MQISIKIIKAFNRKLYFKDIYCKNIKYLNLHYIKIISDNERLILTSPKYLYLKFHAAGLTQTIHV